jgi:hypothetical protein
MLIARSVDIARVEFPRRLLASAVLAVLGVAAALTVGGCGGEALPADQPVTVIKTVTHIEAREPTGKSALKRTHAKAAVASGFADCDPNISVRAATTTCPFAQNVFYEYWASGEAPTVDAYSPAAKAMYTVSCVARQRIRCRGGDGAEIRFPQAAIDAYTEPQAAAFAASADTGPASSSRVQQEAAAPAGEGDVAPQESDDEFCDDHDCIPNYDEGNGERAMCADGTYSQSGGIQGACSHHGGLG